MRFVELSVPRGERAAVLSVLDAENVDYAISEDAGDGYEAVVSFPLAQDDVEGLLDQLHDSGVSENAWTVVLDAETVISDRLERDEEELEEQDDRDARRGRIARDELRAAAADLAPERAERWSYVAMTVVSAVVATVGLLQNSAAVVVGSMVIAPLIGPAMAASVGTVIDDRGLAARGVALQVLGLGLAVASAAVFAAAVRFVGLVPPDTVITTIPEVRSRLAPDFLSLAVALGAGVAGAVSLTTGAGAALVGVMIAVALIPPAATVGLGLAWGQLLVSLGSGVLVLVNVLSINLAALVVLWVIGYRPRDSLELDTVRTRIRKRVRTLVLALVVLSVFLAGVTYLTYQSAQFEQQAETEVDALLDEQPYDDLAHLDSSAGPSETAIAFDEAGLAAAGPINISLTVDRPPGTDYPNFATVLDRRLTERTGRNVTVAVRYVDAARTTGN